MYDINAVVAKNVSYFLTRSPYKSASELARAADVSPNTVAHLLKAHCRTTTAAKPVGYPNLDKLARVAEKLGCEVWMLLHPDIEQALLEHSLYQKVRREIDDQMRPAIAAANRLLKTQK